MLKPLNLGLELDFNIMKKKGVLFFLLFTSFVGLSQNEATRYSNIQADLFYGILIEHDKSLDNAIQGNPYGFLVSWNQINDKNMGILFIELLNYYRMTKQLSKGIKVSLIFEKHINSLFAENSYYFL